MDYKKALEEMKDNTPKTALEWYEREMFKTGFVQHLDIFNEIYKVAKQMEKKQIIKAFNDLNDDISAEQYYNETYNK